MGFFSWLCRGCGKSVLNHYVINKTNAWMNEVAVLLPNGSKIFGGYDGYGRIDTGGGEEMGIDGYKDDIWHRACWEKSGKPEWQGPAANDPKQGHFVGNDYNNEKSPLSQEAK